GRQPAADGHGELGRLLGVQVAPHRRSELRLRRRLRAFRQPVYRPPDLSAAWLPQRRHATRRLLMNWISERLPRCPRWTALALVLLVACGCGKRMSKVEGTVLLDDKPLDGATVVFQPEEGGQPATGMTGSDGVFHLTTRTTGDGARTGNYKVTITKRKESDGGAAPANAGGADS